MKKDFSLLIPKLSKIIADGTDCGAVVMMMQNAGFEITFEAFNESKRSKQDFIHELLVNEYKNGNVPAITKLAELIKVKEYFRPGEYEYVYTEQDAINLSNQIKQCIKNEPPAKPITEEERRDIIYRLMNLHNGLEAVSKALFIKGNFEQCVFEASKFLENYIQNKINDKSLIGKELVSKAFGGNIPILSVYPPPLDKNQKNEQTGFCLLAMGEVMFLKNRISHRTSGSIIKTRSHCLKSLSIISYILENIDLMYSPKTNDEVNLDDIPF